MHKSTVTVLLTVFFVGLALGSDFFVGKALDTDKKIILPPGAKAGGNYSQGILTGGTLYISGQDGADAEGKIPGDFDAEVKQSLDNIGAVLKAAGMTPTDVVSVQVYLTDKARFKQMNAIYMDYFKDPRPTRTTVAVAALMGPGNIEITVTARK
jgi:2-iminobutanoate/2-iminopropanoate deaminase